MTNFLSPLEFLYGAEKAPQLSERLQNLLAGYRDRIERRNVHLTEHDAILITYGDQIQCPPEAPLRTLGVFCRKYLKGAVNGIHILPFYPWTSDDGFSVLDYRKVDPALGDWSDILAMQDEFLLMFDGVINHISAQSEWFKSFLHDESNYRDYFLVVDGSPDLSQVIRPRVLPLLTAFSTPTGEKRVWTTFSDDQIDLNFQNPEVLIEILDILLMYVERGATFIRLDAIAYLWKEIGTSCIHLPQTHRVVQLIRAALDEIAPHVHLITETNVPHEDNISYFGDGYNEAQLVYNFALAPLTLHAFNTGNAGILSAWANTLSLPSDRTTFFNFLASHDGIGLNPARGFLSIAELDALIEKTIAHGGLISYKQNSDGTQSGYEMNINYFDALSDPKGDEPLELQVDRFMAAQAIMLSLVGVPGIYFHSLFGSRGWMDGVGQTGRNRTINRQKFEIGSLVAELDDSQSLRARVYSRYRQLLSARRGSSAFHPHGAQVVKDLHPAVFAIERWSPDKASRVLCLHNVSTRPVQMRLPFDRGIELYTNKPLLGSNVSLKPYQVLWAKL